ncbi:hypothetical protein C2U70_17525 [Bradyrhizobium guangdongense]|uniref:hypothetical protein n=1 Tax=Bradyrhizobium guangdongense TaxID=1325090 RepID=UPI0011267232|nr:hypothetical protein [Bradyrhizobium guangdongense]TPQ34162.1 hypothetical protein C2U70_17525 [Bradyrhizobium guangdongense]
MAYSLDFLDCRLLACLSASWFWLVVNIDFAHRAGNRRSIMPTMQRRKSRASAQGQGAQDAESEALASVASQRGFKREKYSLSRLLKILGVDRATALAISNGQEEQ